MLCTFCANLPCHPHHRERNWAVLGGAWQQPPKHPKGDAQLSPVRHPVCCYQALARQEEREACSWLRGASAGMKKRPWEGNREDTDVSQGTRQKPPVRTDCLGLSLLRTVSENRGRDVEERTARPKYRSQKESKSKGGGKKCCKKTITISLFSTAVTYWSQCR